MDFSTITKFAHRMHTYFVKQHPKFDMEKQSLLRSMKLSEEVGELNEEILSNYGYGKKEKIENYDKIHLEHEIADVILTVCVLAQSLDIDVQKALKGKMKKIKAKMKEKKDDRLV